MVIWDTDFADDTDKNLNNRKGFVMPQDSQPKQFTEDLCQHNGFVGNEFAAPEEEVAAQPAATEVPAAVEPTELNLDVESRLAAIHNPENQ